MKKIILILLSVALVSSAFAQKKGAAKTGKVSGAATEFKTTMDSVSYTIGVNIGSKIKSDKMDMNLDLFFKGIKDVSNGSTPVLTDAQMQELMQKFQQMMMVKQKEMAKELSEKNKKAGDAFLAANKKKEGVITTVSGLQYQILTKGTGKIPTAQDTVVAHYKGTLVDGTEFDNSFKRNEPATFAVGGVIKGWQEALQMMPVGSKWQLVVPAELGYGEQGAGQVIPPGSTLIFEIELISIK
jgi:FKBP-type peptidyl-prolyl cis-trans isomerase FklB